MPDAPWCPTKAQGGVKRGAKKGAKKGVGIRAAVALMLLATTLTACRRHVPPAPPLHPLGFSQSGLDGGGFINVVAFDPAVPGVVLAGGDVSGISRSADYGRTWAPANVGVENLSELKVASILFSPTGEAYAAVGDKGVSGGLLVSTDAGLSWSLRSGVPRFSGGNNDGLPLPAPHPRSTGSLLAVDSGRGMLYAATFDSGIMRSADDGRTWTTLGLAGAFLRALAMDPANPNVLYASAFEGGVYRTEAASTTGAFTLLPTSPASVEEMAFVGSDLYAAAGAEGLFRSPDGGATWTPLLAGGPVWESIAGYSACGATVLYAGANGGGSQGFVRSKDGGSTWTTLRNGAKIHTEEGGAGGPRWWLASQRGFLLGGSVYTASQIAVDPQTPAGGVCLRPRVLVAGRSGIWGTADGGDNWFPMVRGLGVTIVHAVSVDPAAPGRVFAAAADWVALGSADGGSSFELRSPTGGTGFALALDTGSNPEAAYVATGSPFANKGGEIFTSKDAISGGWTPLGLASSAGGRVLAVAVQRVDSQPVVLAAVDGGGVWRKSGADPWAQVNPEVLTQPGAAGGVSLAWPSGSTVFMYDRQTGLWRSDDAGSTWTQVWAQTSDPPFTGYVAADPTKPGRVYVSVGDNGLYRLDGADSGTVEGGQIQPALVGKLRHPGPVTVNSAGVAYACELGTGGAPDILSSTDAGKHWRSLADASYRASAVFPLGITVSPTGIMYVALDGNGLLIGRSAG